MITLKMKDDLRNFLAQHTTPQMNYVQCVLAWAKTQTKPLTDFEVATLMEDMDLEYAHRYLRGLYMDNLME